ncbi:efflux RND transporter periplasmic adaptor subunit [Amphiplicatus metriothermophilus]|uniref:Membrane fusion protein, multidrug efflux system n=1 Tax=Amphiplicatus metriothermophilus TaxID=1519374 RepID=A0A239PJ70_9PROT|nr:efflux RND transporter periplasmic adaptor subunit [Amphiplicatus metriothermophilus]MBB5517840.1 multidrug efflux system membrane fusion protein [Amphiplicatus metriothermophilus]SNT67826.1 membrane fusion protein, multidrug efflux system [Amphiplicatus metriothermophilus]
MKLSASVKIALSIVAATILYFSARTLLSDGRADGPSDDAGETAFAVIATPLKPAEWRDKVTVSGRTEALRKVMARAEISGVVEETPTEPGTFVEPGAVLCRLRVDARAAALEEAEAALAKAELDYRAAAQLAEDGYRSQTAVAAAKAALDQARAAREQAALAVERTRIVAPFRGVFERRDVEIGDFMNVGDACGLLIGDTPFLVVGAVSEKDVAKISPGDRGAAKLVTGETVEGAVRFVGKTADPATRTFRVELEVPNPDGVLRDGVTTAFTIFAGRREAHLLPRSALSLNDEGRIGVRVVGPGDIVAFKPVTLLGEAPEGVWVDGLDGEINLIIRGHEYVKEGQKVAVARAEEPA